MRDVGPLLPGREPDLEVSRTGVGRVQLGVVEKLPDGHRRRCPLGGGLQRPRVHYQFGVAVRDLIAPDAIDPLEPPGLLTSLLGGHTL